MRIGYLLGLGLLAVTNAKMTNVKGVAFVECETGSNTNEATQDACVRIEGATLYKSKKAGLPSCRLPKKSLVDKFYDLCTLVAKRDLGDIEGVETLEDIEIPADNNIPRDRHSTRDDDVQVTQDNRHNTRDDDVPATQDNRHNTRDDDVPATQDNRHNTRDEHVAVARDNRHGAVAPDNRHGAIADRHSNVVQEDDGLEARDDHAPVVPPEGHSPIAEEEEDDDDDDDGDDDEVDALEARDDHAPAVPPEGHSPVEEDDEEDEVQVSTYLGHILVAEGDDDDYDPREALTE